MVSVKAKPVSRSDKAAKAKYKEVLCEHGYEVVDETNQPTDIVAIKDEEKWFFEIKATSKSEDELYFGAATLTEWRQAFATPDRFIFVVARLQADGSYRFEEYTHEEFMAFSCVPPFKVYFNIPPRGKKKTNRRTAVVFTEEVLRILDDCYDKLKTK